MSDKIAKNLNYYLSLGKVLKESFPGQSSRDFMQFYTGWVTELVDDLIKAKSIDTAGAKSIANAVLDDPSPVLTYIDKIESQDISKANAAQQKIDDKQKKKDDKAITRQQKKDDRDEVRRQQRDDKAALKQRKAERNIDLDYEEELLRLQKKYGIDPKLPKPNRAREKREKRKRSYDRGRGLGDAFLGSDDPTPPVS